MTIEIKKSVKPIKYKSAIDILEDRLDKSFLNKNKELIWILEHELFILVEQVFDNEILDKSINFIKINTFCKNIISWSWSIRFFIL